MTWLLVAGAIIAIIGVTATVLSIQTAMHRRDRTGRGCGCHRSRRGP